jgi:aspartyl-tRNA(Asn)/glutamyl-tRNA(Gln) amidotransferase subunit C
MKITKKEVERVAQLARLHLSDQELETMTGQLDTILSYVDKLDELDTSGIQPTTHAFFLCNALREDTIVSSLPQADALANSPCHNGEAFIVPRVL